MEWTNEISSVTEEYLSNNQTIEPVIILPENVSRIVSPPTSVWGSGQAQIPLYVLIFLLAVVGNSLVIVTLVQNKKMRTVTNVFLLNLAVSDLLLGVFCMPFTLVGTLLRQFVFGEVMCKAIPYIQAVSVAVSAWTLVAISIERYFAICRPLQSRNWQTLCHAYKMIAVVWIFSCLLMTPIAVLSTLQPIKKSGKFKCREAWPQNWSEQAFNIILDLFLLVIPLVVMTVTYSLIILCLRKGLRLDEKCKTLSKKRNILINSNSASANEIAQVSHHSVTFTSHDTNSTSTWSPVLEKKSVENLRHSNLAKSLANKKRVVKMLFVVVLEFFVSWTPLYVVNTIALLDPVAVYGGLGVGGISLCHLMAYASSCCNPITYCFMNLRFRRAFLSAFSCCSRKKKTYDTDTKSTVSPERKTTCFYDQINN